MNYPSSMAVTRLITRLINATQPEFMTLDEIQGIVNAIKAIQVTDPALVLNVPALVLYLRELIELQDQEQYCISSIALGTPIIGSDEATQ